MKRIWVAIGVLAVVIALCIVELTATVNITDELADTITTAQTSLKKGDEENARALCRQAFDDWQTHYDTMATFIAHSKLEQIDQSVTVTQTYLERGQLDDFMAEADRTRTQMERFKDTELPSLSNIL